MKSRAEASFAIIATVTACIVGAVGSAAVAKVGEGDSVLMLLSGFIGACFATVALLAFTDGIRKHSADALDLCRKVVAAVALAGVVLSPTMKLSFAFIGSAAGTITLLTLFLSGRRREERNARITTPSYRET